MHKSVLTDLLTAGSIDPLELFATAQAGFREHGRGALVIEGPYIEDPASLPDDGEVQTRMRYAPLDTAVAFYEGIAGDQVSALRMYIESYDPEREFVVIVSLPPHQIMAQIVSLTFTVTEFDA